MSDTRVVWWTTFPKQKLKPSVSKVPKALPGRAAKQRTPQEGPFCFQCFSGLVGARSVLSGFVGDCRRPTRHCRLPCNTILANLWVMICRLRSLHNPFRAFL